MAEKKSSDRLIDGKSVAREVVTELANEVQSFSERHRQPHLVVIIVGDDPASQVYVRSKVRTAEKTHIKSTLIAMPADTNRETLLAKVVCLNNDEDVDGILVQMPLPGHLDQWEVIEHISPDKDVDGLHPCSLGRLAADMPRFVPCTPFGVSVLLDRYNVETEGKRVVIVGRSMLVGKPLALLLSRKHKRGNATVTICHSRTKNLADITIDADILIAAIGRAEMITGEMIKPGAVVIDVGVNRVPDSSSERGYRLTGDVEFTSALERASLITPVPGGVGPMTVAMLMKNTLTAAKRACGVDHD